MKVSAMFSGLDFKKWRAITINKLRNSRKSAKIEIVELFASLFMWVIVSM
jgi:hypothetical protein